MISYVATLPTGTFCGPSVSTEITGPVRLNTAGSLGAGLGPGPAGPVMTGAAIAGPGAAGLGTATPGPGMPDIPGPAIDGLAMVGPAIEGPAVDGASMEGLAGAGLAVRGSAIVGAAIMGPRPDGSNVAGPKSGAAGTGTLWLANGALPIVAPGIAGLITSGPSWSLLPCKAVGLISRRNRALGHGSVRKGRHTAVGSSRWRRTAFTEDRIPYRSQPR